MPGNFNEGSSYRRSAVLLEDVEVFEGEFNILYMKLIDSMYFLAARRDTLFHVYDENGNYITGFGHEGWGPGEFEIIPGIDDVIMGESSTNLLAEDQARKELGCVISFVNNFPNF